MDRDGTRGVISVTERLTDTIKDIAELKLDMHSFKTATAAWFGEHAKQHDEDVRQRAIEREQDQKARIREREQDQRNRTNSRRWVIGIFIAVMAAVGGMYEFLNVILQHVHG